MLSFQFLPRVLVNACRHHTDRWQTEDWKKKKERLAVSKHETITSEQTSEANKQKKKKKGGWQTELATYSCCYHAPCYYGACDWATWGQASRCGWGLCPNASGPRRASWSRRRPGTLPPAAERPTYVCYLQRWLHNREHSFEEFGPQEEKKKTTTKRNDGNPNLNFFFVVVLGEN